MHICIVILCLPFLVEFEYGIISDPKKGKGENQQQTQPSYDARRRDLNLGHIGAGGKYSNH